MIAGLVQSLARNAGLPLGWGNMRHRARVVLGNMPLKNQEGIMELAAGLANLENVTDQADVAVLPNFPALGATSGPVAKAAAAGGQGRIAVAQVLEGGRKAQGSRGT